MKKVLIAAGADLVTANATGKRPIDLVREDRVGNTLHEAMAIAAADGLARLRLCLFSYNSVFTGDLLYDSEEDGATSESDAEFE